MRDLFTPIKNRNINKDADYKQEKNRLCNNCNSLDVELMKCDEYDICENYIDFYYKDYIEHCKWEAFIE